jgi:hypothetical protein
VYAEKASNQPHPNAQEPPPCFDQEAFAELRAIVSSDHQEMFGERGIKDVWRKLLPAPLKLSDELSGSYQKRVN